MELRWQAFTFRANYPTTMFVRRVSLWEPDSRTLLEGLVFVAVVVRNDRS